MVTVRRIGRVGLVVVNVSAAVAVVRAVAGPWVAAVVVAPVLVAVLLAVWATVEARLFARRPHPVARPADGHAAFARALATVAAAYLAECEREAER